MKKILNALFLTLLAVFTFSSCSDVPAPYDILGEGDVPGLTGDGTKENPYNIEAAQQKQDGSIAWVQGYIVGALENVYDDKGEFAGNKASFTAPFTITSNVLIAESPDETNESKCLPVKIKNGSDLSTALNLKDHPENKGGVLLIQGELSAGFGKAALINTTAAVFNNKEIGEEQGGETPGGSTTITENQPYSVSFASDLAGFTVENKVSEGLTGDVWYYSKKYTAATSSSYNGTTNVPAEGWFLSPVLDMTAISKATLTFEHSSYSEGKPEELMLKVREENAANWTDLVISNYSNGRDNHVTTTVDLTAFAAKKAQIAFVYKNLAGGTNNTWYIYNLKVAAGEGGGSIDPDPTEGKLIFTEKYGSDVDANILTATTAISSFTHWDNSYSYSATTADIRAIAHRTPDNTTETKKVNNIWFPASKSAEFVINGINIAGYTKFIVAYEVASNVYATTETDNLNNLKLTLNDKEVTPTSKEVVGNGKASGIFHEMQVEISVAGTGNSTLKFSTNGTDNKFGIRLYNIRLYAAESGGTDPEPGEGIGLPFTEGFGVMADYDKENKTVIANWTHFDTKLTIVDTKAMADIRVPSKTSADACLWLPSSFSGTDKSTEIEISGFNSTGYTSLTLSYDLACGKGNTSQAVIKVKCDGTEVTVPAVTLEKANVFYPVSITNIPAGTKKITFVSGSENTMGFRLDNIKLEGIK